MAIALGLAPGTFVRSEVVRDYTAPAAIAPIDFDEAKSGPLSLAGAWELTSENSWFGGYSALALQSDGSLLAASDQGRLLSIPAPGVDVGVPQILTFPNFPAKASDKADIEALAFDPATARSWVAIETNNRIRRFSQRRPRHKQVRPKAMKGWPINAGAESLVRLPDGRFIAIAEADMGNWHHRALMFRGDPIDSPAVTRFRLEGENGYYPSDAALLPDGRVIVVLRKLALAWPFHFQVRLATFDPAEIAHDTTIALRPLAAIDTPFPAENYEGIAVVEEGSDWIVWLISDDNFNRYQRTLLLKLRWTRQKARR